MGGMHLSKTGVAHHENGDNYDFDSHPMNFERVTTCAMWLNKASLSAPSMEDAPHMTRYMQAGYE